MNIILFDKLEDENKLSLKDERAKHIKKVLKLNVGDEFSSGEINGAKGLSKITEFDENYIYFSFTVTNKDSYRLYPITLLVSQVRPICMKRILREAVSLGVQKIVLSGADLTEKSYAKANFYVNGEYKRVLVDGAMQAAQTGISAVEFTSSVDEAIKLFDKNCDKIVLDNVIKSKSLSFYEPSNNFSEVVLAIGPERGFSDRERKLFIDADFKAASLGSRVLRTETACSAGLSLVLSKMGLI